MGILSIVSFGVMGTSGFLTPYQIDQPYSIYSIDVYKRQILSCTQDNIIDKLSYSMRIEI